MLVPAHASFHWFLPTYGDSRNLMAGGHGAFMAGDRPATLKYLKQLAAAAEANKFDAVLTPTGLWCEDAWLTTAMLVDSTETLRFLVAARPGLVSPTITAQMAATFQWQSGGRLALNIVTGGDSVEQRAFGDHLDKAQRYARAGEFLHVFRELSAPDPSPVTYKGDYIDIESAVLQRYPDPAAPIFFGGSSPEALTVAARYADTYLTWGEPPAQAAGKIDKVRSLAVDHGRTLDYGVRLHVISRDTEEQAWAEANRLLGALDPEVVRRAQETLARSESEGQRRMLELHGGAADFTAGVDARTFEIYPGLWSGVGLVRGGAGTALVGSHDQVASLIGEYVNAGFSHFILSGYPHLEEAYHFGEGVRPQLAAKGIVANDVTRGDHVGGAFLPDLAVYTGPLTETRQPAAS